MLDILMKHYQVEAIIVGLIWVIIYDVNMILRELRLLKPGIEFHEIEATSGNKNKNHSSLTKDIRPCRETYSTSA
jgi:hypothetical protein